MNWIPSLCIIPTLARPRDTADDCDPCDGSGHVKFRGTLMECPMCCGLATVGVYVVRVVVGQVRHELRFHSRSFRDALRRAERCAAKVRPTAGGVPLAGVVRVVYLSTGRERAVHQVPIRAGQGVRPVPA